MTINLVDYKTYPPMTRWFNPLLLIKLLWNVIVSGLFGQYADRRLIIAALDTCPPGELLARAQSAKLDPDADGAVWLDFVADLGDGFDPTYAIATLIAAPSLQVADITLP